MFVHAAGFRPLWPVILFLPWLLVGIAWLVRSLSHGKRQVHPLVQVARRAPVRRAGVSTDVTRRFVRGRRARESALRVPHHSHRIRQA